MNLISPAEADALLAGHVQPAADLVLPLPDCGGHVLREDILADRPLPPFDRVTMDGIALRASGWIRGNRTFRRVAVQAAGEPALELAMDDTCVEIMTGAMLPAGADTIVPAEQLTWNGDQANVTGDIVPGRYIHRCGSDAAAGALLVPAGARVTPGVAAAAAAVGSTNLRVAQPPRVTLVDTGNELVDIARTPATHEIRRSNAATLTALLQAGGAGRVVSRHARDTEQELLDVLTEAVNDSDVVLVTGGISHGRFDLVAATLIELGVHFLFQGIRQNPGKPFAAGLTRDGKPVFALPGNPVSSAVCCARYVLPFIAAHLGIAIALPARARLATVPAPQPGWTRFELCRFAQEPDGGVRAERLPLNTSGDLRSLAAAHGFVEVTDESSPLRPCWSLRGGPVLNG